jgi:transposase
MSQKLEHRNRRTVGIDIGKNSFHVVGLDQRGAIVLRQKWSRGQVEARFANMPPCLVGMEACVGAHHLSRKLKELGHDARLTKTADQLDLQALHRVRERLVSQRTGIINQIRAFLLERGIAVRQGQRFLRAELPRILTTPPDVLSPRMVRVIEDLARTGAGSTSGSRVCRARSRLLRVRMPVASG